MLIKLTDQCSMGCPHCMEDARETGTMMDLNTFKRAVGFGMYLGTPAYILSGGEPTENPLLLDMCGCLSDILRGTFSTFSITSNGMWLKDPQKWDMMEKIGKLPSCAGIQVYTNKAWYKEYDFVVSNIDEYKKFPKVVVDIDSHIFMQDLGRARWNSKAQKEVSDNPHFMSCLNTALLARQSDDPTTFGMNQLMHKQFCKPSVDALGNVHMSESRLCPSVGRITRDSFDTIWQGMKKFKPCGKCRLYDKFLASDRPDIVKARQILEL